MCLDDMDISPELFEERLAWARRTGVLRWLWPAVAPSDWRLGVRAIEGVARDVLTKGSCELRTPCNPMAMSLAAYTSGTGPLLGHWIERGFVATDADTAALFEVHLDHNRQRTRMLTAKLGEIATLLDQAGIGVTVFKGMDLAHSYYPEPAARPVSDIDLLCDSDAAFAAAGELLARNGFEAISENEREVTYMPSGHRRAPRSLLHVHRENPWSVDLHVALDYRLAGGPPTRIGALNRRCEPGEWAADKRVRTLTQPARLLHLTAHIGSDLHTNPSLIRLIDLVVVVRGDIAAGRLDWDDFVRAGAESGALGLAYPGLALAEKLAPGTVDSAALQACARASTRIARGLVRDLAPADAQRLERTSVRTHFVWVRTPLDLARHLAAALWPATPWRMVLARYAWLVRRAWSGGFRL